MAKFKSSGNYVLDQKIGRDFEMDNDYPNALAAYKSAIALCKKFKELPPPNAYLRMAIIYRKLDDREKEIAILKRAIKETAYPQARTTHGKLVDRLKKLDPENKLEYKPIRQKSQNDNFNESMYKDWLDRNIVSKKEVADLIKLKKQHNKKFDALLNHEATSNELPNKKKTLFERIFKRGGGE